MNHSIYKAFSAELAAIAKLAADEREPQPWTEQDLGDQKAEWAKHKPQSPVSVALHGIAGVGLGTLAGGLAGRGLEHLAGRTGTNLSPHLARIGAISGAAAGAAHQLWRAKELEALRRDAEYSTQTAEKFPRK